MHYKSPHSFGSRAGYSMAEILAALVIVGILTAIAWPRLSGIGGVSSRKGALNQLTADVGLARMTAIRSGNEAQVRINTAGTEYSVVVRDTTGAFRTVKTVRLTRNYPGVTISPTNDSLVFDSRGLRRSLTAKKSLVISHSVRGTTARDSLVISPLGKVNRVR